jgi:hypothetical protein
MVVTVTLSLIFTSPPLNPSQSLFAKERSYPLTPYPLTTTIKSGFSLKGNTVIPFPVSHFEKGGLRGFFT